MSIPLWYALFHTVTSGLRVERPSRLRASEAGANRHWRWTRFETEDGQQWKRYISLPCWRIECARVVSVFPN